MTVDKTEVENRKARGRCFVIQPFDNGEYDARYREIFVPAIRDAGLTPHRVDQDPASGVVISKIEAGIRRAAICLADITENNPNIWYEFGYASPAQRPIVIVSNAKRRTVYPFDVRHLKVIPYRTARPSAMTGLRKAITESLIATLDAAFQRQGIFDAASEAPALDGTWSAFYVEDDKGKPPYQVEETVTLNQNGRDLQGTYHCETYTRSDFALEAQVHGTMIQGTYCALGRKSVAGRGSFQLQASRDSEWLEGFCTWSDYDSGTVQSSKWIWFRPESIFSEQYREEIKNILDAEIEVLRIRNRAQRGEP
jgi:hypothetical protein